MKFTIEIKGKPFDVEISESGRKDGSYRIVVDGEVFTASVTNRRTTVRSSTIAPAVGSSPIELDDNDDSDVSITAPMPGTIVSIAASEGDAVARGTELLTLETMKMHVPLFAPRDVRIKKIHVKTGDIVKVEQVLVEFDS
ncbi:MAG: biotin/lipoyl-containing protein [Pseudomonadota bacterium]